MHYEQAVKSSRNEEIVTVCPSRDDGIGLKTCMRQQRHHQRYTVGLYGESQGQRSIIATETHSIQDEATDDTPWSEIVRLDVSNMQLKALPHAKKFTAVKEVRFDRSCRTVSDD